MVLNDIKRFNEFADSCVNRYVAVQTIAKWARDLGSELSDYRISESKLIEIILNGKYYTKGELSQRKRDDDPDHISDILEWAIDEKIVDEVKRLYRLSIKNKRLQSCNNTKFTSGEQSKINILLRMLWYSIE